MVSTLAEAVDLAGQVILSSQIADGLDAIGSSYRETINQAKELRHKEKEGIALTEEELALQQRLREEGSQGVVELDALIQQFRSFWATTPEETKAVDALIKQAELLKQSLEVSGATSQFDLLGMEVEDLGNDFEQLARTADGALAQLQQAAKTAVDLIQQQVEAGAISPEQAEERLAQVRNNAKVDVATRQQAQQAIIKINETGTQQRVDAINAEITAVETAVLDGSKTEVQAAQETTRLKIQQVQIQLEAIQAAIAEERRLRREMVQEQLAALDTQIAAAQQAAANATTGQESQAAQEQVAALQAQRQTVAESINLQSEKEKQLIQKEQELHANLKKVAIEGERDVLQAQLKEIDRATSKLNAEISLAATQREQALLEPRNPEDRENLEHQIRNSIQKTADLTLQLARQEEQEQKAAIGRVQTHLQRQFKARMNALQAETQGY